MTAEDIHDDVRDKLRQILKEVIEYPTETELKIYEQVVLPLLSENKRWITKEDAMAMIEQADRACLPQPKAEQKYHCTLCGWEGKGKGLETYRLEDYCPQCKAKDYLEQKEKRYKMKTEEIIEGNKLIAEFMNHVPQDELTNKKREEFGMPKKNYHTSWDWLMPVYWKIGSINELSAYPKLPYFRDRHPAFHEIKLFWEQAIDFINWYNTIKPATLTYI